MSFSGASISLATQQNISHNTETIIVFETDDFDVGGWIDNTTNKRLKIPADVEYVKFTITASIAAMTGSEANWRILEETGPTAYFITTFVSAGLSGTENMIWTYPVLKVSAGQVYYVDVDMSTGSLDCPVTGNAPASFSVVNLT